MEGFGAGSIQIITDLDPGAQKLIDPTILIRKNAYNSRNNCLFYIQYICNYNSIPVACADFLLYFLKYLLTSLQERATQVEIGNMYWITEYKLFKETITRYR
jgi:hypothetical protein